MTIRVGLCEDDLLFRELLGETIDSEPDMKVTGTASSREELASLLRRQTFDVLLLDLNLSGGGSAEGLEAAIDLRNEPTHMKIIVLTSLDDEQLVLHAFTIGKAVNYIMKEYYRDIPEAIRQAFRNETSIHHSAAPKVLAALTEWNNGDIRSKITSQQLRILTLLSQGLDRKQIAAQLFYTEQSVNNEIFKLTKLLKGKFPYLEWLRLKRHNTAEVVELARKLNIIQ
ncbi:response regulator transcription factor, partial [Gordoniibacillus kamchatkensis]|uniref:response regulator transcription factor n=1 Tax=Gordoniibacillus kamchatkensis TaxID=1590651 RepID=UPI0005974A4C